MASLPNPYLRCTSQNRPAPILGEKGTYEVIDPCAKLLHPSGPMHHWERRHDPVPDHGWQPEHFEHALEVNGEVALYDLQHGRAWTGDHDLIILLRGDQCIHQAAVLHVDEPVHLVEQPDAKLLLWDRRARRA